MTEESLLASWDARFGPNADDYVHGDVEYRVLHALRALVLSAQAHLNTGRQQLCRPCREATAMGREALRAVPDESFREA